MKPVRRHMIFRGRVQGVGFRYRAYITARSLGLTGYVRNLADGTVELEAQGEEEAIEKLVESLKKEEYIEIRGIMAEDRKVKKEKEFVLS